jgi:hypothetical protein
MAGRLRRTDQGRLDGADQAPGPPMSGSAAEDGWTGSAPRSTRRRTGSRCTPSDFSSGLGSWPISTRDWFYNKLLGFWSPILSPRPVAVNWVWAGSEATLERLCADLAEQDPREYSRSSGFKEIGTHRHRYTNDVAA